jgi:hypothetical protein
MSPTPSRCSHRILIVAGVLLLIVASRFTRLGDIEMELDEVWSIWQTFGTPQQILQWTPYDWTPTYYLILGAWKELAGIHPIALRVLSALVFLPGCAFMYQFVRRRRGEGAGLSAMLAYAAFGYGIFLSLQVRAYTFVYMLMPLALWLTHRYFDRPGFRRAVPLALVLLAMFYLYLPSAVGIVVLGIYTLVIYGIEVWRWWLPGVLALIPALPEIIAKIGLAISRTQATSQIETTPFLEKVGGLYESYAGTTFPLWIALFAVATALIAYRPMKRQTLALLVWVLLGPVIVYYLNPMLGLAQQPRYSFWVLPGIALWLAWGITYLPRAGVAVASALLLIPLFAPLPVDDYQYISWPVAQRFEWLKDNLRWGDVIVVDPNCDCPSPETWDYFLQVYFPDGGLEFVNDPADHRRIVYVVFEGREDAGLARAVQANRVFHSFSGPPWFMFKLYEAPPDIEGIPFENGLRFHGFDILEDSVPLAGRLVRREGEPVRLRLWWSADRPIELDYSIGLYLVRESDGWMAHQVDGPPQVADGPQATSQWTTRRYYVEERELMLPYPAANWTFNIYLAVYQWWDSARIAAPGVDDEGRLYLTSVPITAW